MRKREVISMMSPDLIDRIKDYQHSRGIKHFYDAVEAYILRLERTSIKEFAPVDGSMLDR